MRLKSSNHRFVGKDSLRKKRLRLHRAVRFLPLTYRRKGFAEEEAIETLIVVLKQSEQTMVGKDSLRKKRLRLVHRSPFWSIGVQVGKDSLRKKRLRRVHGTATTWVVPIVGKDSLRKKRLRHYHRRLDARAEIVSERIR